MSAVDHGCLFLNVICTHQSEKFQVPPPLPGALAVVHALVGCQALRPRDHSVNGHDYKCLNQFPREYQ